MPNHTLRSNASRAGTEPVLVSVSIVVAAPISACLPKDAVTDAVQEAFLDNVAARLGAGIASLENEPWFVENAGSLLSYLEKEDNASFCSRCGRWTSDFDKPDCIHALMYGRSVNGSVLCDECEHYTDVLSDGPGSKSE